MTGFSSDMARMRRARQRFWPRLYALRRAHAQSRFRGQRLIPAVGIELKRWKTAARERPNARR